MDSFSTKRMSLQGKQKKTDEQIAQLQGGLQQLQNVIRNLSEAVNVLVQVVGPESYETQLAEYRLNVTENNIARALAEGVLAESNDTILTEGQGLIVQLVERMKDTNEPVAPGKAYLEFDGLTPEGKKLLTGATAGTVVTGPNGNTLEVTKVFVRAEPKAEAPASAATLAAVPELAEVEPTPEAEA